MDDAGVRYCDVSLPVPLDQPFTYGLPLTLRHRVQPGCRVVVPFGPRKLTGVVLRVHGEAPDARSRDVVSLIDEQPVLDTELLRLAEWIAGYYCAPLGEVLRSMTPVSAEVRKTKHYALTDQGRDIVRRLALAAQEGDATVRILQILESRSASVAYLQKKVPNSASPLRTLEKKGWIAVEETHTERDPLRAQAEKLQVEFQQRQPAGEKLRKAERELLSFLELHPGPHALAPLETMVKNASVAARALARRGLATLQFVSAAPQGWATRPPHVLNPSQQAAYEAVQQALAAQRYATCLLQGVTGSGKTEVYLQCIEASLALGRAALLLVPEIALTPAVAAQFANRFGDRVAILHSAFSDLERVEQWRRIRSGQATVVVGTRSGVFAPVQRLGLVIVDEEHDGSYKQGETPRYHGRDVAILRAQHAQAVVLLGSATPSLESRHNADKGKYALLRLRERIAQRPLPEVEIIDMRLEFAETRKMETFSRRLLEQMGERLTAGEQTMLLHNRRGFSSFVVCRACGERVNCVNCSVTLTFHKRDNRLLCHYCHHMERVPELCPKCQSDHIQFLGTGSERVEDELHRHFPGARIARLDRDTVGSKRQFEHILHGFRAHEYDILVGTQMIAKGHDIHNVTLVGVTSADIGLGMPDFRAAERTFQLLTQVAGRAGRGELPGRVVLQTLNPDHYAVRFAAAQDFDAFFRREMEFRAAMRYPPYAALANVMVRAERQDEALRMSGELEGWLTLPPREIKVLGPAPAPVPRIKNEFRFQCLLKSTSRKVLHDVLEGLRQKARQQKWPATALTIDVDPLSLL